MANKMVKQFGRSVQGAFRWALLLALLVAALALPAQVAAQPSPMAAINGWLGEYYGNADLTGSPAFIRDDSAIDFDWGYGSPAAVIPADGFSVRWTRYLAFASGTYRFYATSDDGVRVWLDGEVIVDQWHVSPGDTYMAQRSLAAGNHLLRVEYYEEGGGAKVRFWWDPSAAGVFPDWKGEYWANSGLYGNPLLVRNDQSINFDWAWGSPDPAIPADSFSVRWTRRSYFDAATYRFHAVVDGEVQIWVGAQLVMDVWHDGRSAEFVADYRPARGEYNMKVEFFETRGDAQVHVWWEKVDNYQPYDPSPAYPDWRGQYWSNQDLQGNPRVVRNDGAINFDWDIGRAAPELPADRFSARWDRRIRFEPGTYTFYAQADNGIRVYLDGALILDRWYTNSQEIHEVRRTLEGSHHVTVEYYDNGGPAMVHFWWGSDHHRWE